MKFNSANDLSSSLSVSNTCLRWIENGEIVLKIDDKGRIYSGPGMTIQEAAAKAVSLTLTLTQSSTKAD